MNVIVIETHLTITIAGLSAPRSEDNAGKVAHTLSNEVWKILRDSTIKNSGKNIWAYEQDEVFAGVGNPKEYSIPGLKTKKIEFDSYAYFKYTGPYNNLSSVAEQMISELKAAGYSVKFPHLEIYDHPVSDENQSVTELIMGVE